MRILAQITSILFHPLLILFYSLFLLLCLKPHLIGALHWSEQTLLIILIFIYTCVVPAIGIALLKFTGLVKSYEMKDRIDRYAPLIICAIFYLWLWVNLKAQDNIPKLLIAFILASVIGIFFAFVINLKMRISLHAMAIAAFCSYWIIIRFWFSDDHIYQFRFLPSSVSAFEIHHLIGISLLLAGWIGTSRLILKAHDHTELYLGYFIGVISVILAFSYTY